MFPLLRALAATKFHFKFVVEWSFLSSHSFTAQRHVLPVYFSVDLLLQGQLQLLLITHTGLIVSISIQITALTACITLAIKSDIVIFMHVKSIKVASGFNLIIMKKIHQVALLYKKIKNKY